MSVDTKVQILRGMALAFFATAWADQAEETGNSHVISGKEIMDILPPVIDPAALKAATDLAIAICKANAKGKFTPNLQELYEQQPAGWTPQQWGHYAAMQAMGTPLGLSDNVPCTVKVPDSEFGAAELSIEYFRRPDSKSQLEG